MTDGSPSKVVNNYVENKMLWVYRDFDQWKYLVYCEGWDNIEQ